MRTSSSDGFTHFFLGLGGRLAVGQGYVSMAAVLATVPTPWGELVFHTLGTCLGLSLLASWYVTVWLARKENLERRLAVNGLLVAALAAALATVLLVGAGWFEAFGQNPSAGFTSLCLIGVTGGGLASCRYARKVGTSISSWLRVLAPVLGLWLLGALAGWLWQGPHAP